MSIKISKYVERALKNSNILDPKNGEKFVIVSDTHLGAGDNADESLNVQHLIFYALSQYFKQGYTLVLNGDNWELAETHDIEKIKNAHDDIMWILSEFHNDGRLILIKGNHEEHLTPKKLRYRKSQYDGQQIDFLKDVELYESTQIKDLVVLHGSQFFSKYHSWFNKVLMALGPIWKKWQLFFKDYHIAEYTGWQEADRCQTYFSELGKKLNKHFVIGHTHKCNFKLDNCTDCGSFGCMPRCITAVEYYPDRKNFDNLITVKWAVIPKDLELNQGVMVTSKTVIGSQKLKIEVEE